MEFLRRTFGRTRELDSEIKWTPLASAADEEDEEPSLNPPHTQPRYSRLDTIQKILNGIPLVRVYVILSTSLLALLLLYLLAANTSTSEDRRVKSDIFIPDTAFPEFIHDPLFLAPLPPENGLYYTPIPAAHNTPPPIKSRFQNTSFPFFIGFTRNHKILTQTVLSYIASGWPRDSIIIVDNTGTMTANENGQLSEGNPFYLNYTLFRARYGVSILRTHTLLNFAQLQNHFMATALSRKWDYYYWAHSDAPIVGHEKGITLKNYKSPFQFAQEELRRLDASSEKWSVRWYNFDYLTLVNVKAMEVIGAWDTFIPYYSTDCDWYSRARMSGYKIINEKEQGGLQIGRIFDVGNTLPKPEEAFFPRQPPFPKRPPNAPPNYRLEAPKAPLPYLHSPRYQILFAGLEHLEHEKKSNSGGRNFWQNQDEAGRGEPWTYDPKGFQKAWWQMNELGWDVYFKKWGINKRQCRLEDAGKNLGDIWAGEWKGTKERRDEGMEVGFKGL